MSNAPTRNAVDICCLPLIEQTMAPTPLKEKYSWVRRVFLSGAGGVAMGDGGMHAGGRRQPLPFAIRRWVRGCGGWRVRAARPLQAQRRISRGAVSHEQ